MDLNLSRRERELAIASEVASELLREVTMVQAARPEVVAHHFAVVCERLGVKLDDAAVGRVLRYTINAVIRKERRVEDLKREMDRVTEAFNRARV